MCYMFNLLLYVYELILPNKYQSIINTWIPLSFFSVTIDLVDLDGQITNLSGRTKEYANELVTGRGTYILIRVESKLSYNDLICKQLFKNYYRYKSNYYSNCKGETTINILAKYMHQMLLAHFWKYSQRPMVFHLANVKNSE